MGAPCCHRSRSRVLDASLRLVTLSMVSSQKRLWTQTSARRQGDTTATAAAAAAAAATLRKITQRQWRQRRQRRRQRSIHSRVAAAAHNMSTRLLHPSHPPEGDTSVRTNSRCTSLRRKHHHHHTHTPRRPHRHRHHSSNSLHHSTPHSTHHSTPHSTPRNSNGSIRPCPRSLPPWRQATRRHSSLRPRMTRPLVAAVTVAAAAAARAVGARCPPSCNHNAWNVAWATAAAVAAGYPRRTTHVCCRQEILFTKTSVCQRVIHPGLALNKTSPHRLHLFLRLPTTVSTWGEGIGSSGCSTNETLVINTNALIYRDLFSTNTHPALRARWSQGRCQ